MPGYAKVTIGFSTCARHRSAGADFAALDRYPYGCSEQLTSRALPMVYLEDLKLAAGKVAPDDEHQRVQEAINLLLEREDNDGSFGLWRLGDREATPYLGAYIVDFLARAKVKGYAIPDEALDRAYRGMDHYDSSGDGWRTEVFWAPLAGSNIAATRSLAGKAYADYVLARAKRADIGELRYLHDTGFEPAGAGGEGPTGRGVGDHGRQGAVDPRAGRGGTVRCCKPRPRWDWAGDYYRTPIRDIAILLTLSAEIGDRPIGSSG